MTIWDLQKLSIEESNKTLAKMSLSEVKTVIDSCGTPQGKSAVKKQWEKLTGKKYQ